MRFVQKLPMQATGKVVEDPKRTFTIKVSDLPTENHQRKRSGHTQKTQPSDNGQNKTDHRHFYLEDEENEDRYWEDDYHSTPIDSGTEV
jgi:hypothetical protein